MGDANKHQCCASYHYNAKYNDKTAICFFLHLKMLLLTYNVYLISKYYNNNKNGFWQLG